MGGVQVVGDDSDAPDIYFFVIGFHIEYFWGHVDGGAADGVELAVGEDFTDSEV